MKFLILILLTFFSFSFYFCQIDSLKQIKIDSLKLILEKDSIHTYRFKKLRPYIDIDRRNSFSNKNPNDLSGLQLGVIVNEYHTFGFGLYTISKYAKNFNPINSIYKVNQFGYANVFYEYFLLNKKYFEIKLPFEIGIGGFKAQLKDSVAFIQKTSSIIFPVGAAFKFIVKPIKWAGISSMIGYRYIYKKETFLNYDGLYYSIGIWLDFRQIYRDIKYYKIQKRNYRKQINNLLYN